MKNSTRSEILATWIVITICAIIIAVGGTILYHSLKYFKENPISQSYPHVEISQLPTPRPYIPSVHPAGSAEHCADIHTETGFTTIWNNSAGCFILIPDKNPGNSYKKDSKPFSKLNAPKNQL